MSRFEPCGIRKTRGDFFHDVKMIIGVEGSDVLGDIE
jgi:hypothetical protein